MSRRHEELTPRDVPLETGDGRAYERFVRVHDLLFRSIFRSAVNPMVISDLDGRILETNPRALGSLGYTAGELQAMDASSPMELLDEADLIDDLDESTDDAGGSEAELDESDLLPG